MCLSHFSLGDVAISHSAPVEEGNSKTPPKRLTQAKADAALVPERR